MNSQIAVRLDRLILSSDARGASPPTKVQDYRTLKDFCIRPESRNRTYDRVRIMRSSVSGTSVFWQYGRRKAWLKPWRIAIVGDDEEGITLDTLQPIVRHCHYGQLVLIEIALDFDAITGVNRRFVRRHALFGKSRRVMNRGGPEQLRYGSRKSRKLVRCYAKQNLNTYRVEIEVHSQLLRAWEINQVRDLPDAGMAIFPQHVRFVQLHWPSVQRYLSRRFVRRTSRDILIEARRRSEVSLTSATRYLRRKGVQNVQRFFRDLPVNRLAAKALNDWANEFRGYRHA